jgi:hypothetical protein
MTELAHAAGDGCQDGLCPVHPDGCLEQPKLQVHINPPEPISVTSDEDRERVQALFRDVVDAVARAAWIEGLRQGVAWYVEHGGQPNKMTSRTLIHRVGGYAGSQPCGGRVDGSLLRTQSIGVVLGGARPVAAGVLGQFGEPIAQDALRFLRLRSERPQTTSRSGRSRRRAGR